MSSFEFEDLFDVRAAGMTPMDEAYWRTEPLGLKKGVMGYRTETLKAGPRLEATVYPLFGRNETARIRKVKQHQTRIQVENNNRERSIRHLVQLVDANFGPDDIKLDLTYGRSEPTWEKCKNDVKKFIGKLRRLRKKRGLPELKYVYVIEDSDEDGTKVRPHAHMILNAGIGLKELEQIWQKGLTKAEYLQPSGEGLEGRVRYMVKSQRRKGKRKWGASRNLKQPKVRISNTKVSNAKIRTIARGFEAEAKEIMEKIYPGYDYVRTTIRYSDYTDGVMIRVLMREREARRR